MTKLLLCFWIVLVGLVGISACDELRPSYQSPSTPYRSPTYHINVTPSTYLPVWSETKAYHFKDGHTMVIAPYTADDRYEPVHLFERDGYFSRPYLGPQRRPIPFRKPVVPTRTYKPALPPVPVQIED